MADEHTPAQAAADHAPRPAVAPDLGSDFSEAAAAQQPAEPAPPGQADVAKDAGRPDATKDVAPKAAPGKKPAAAKKSSPARKAAAAKKAGPPRKTEPAKKASSPKKAEALKPAAPAPAGVPPSSPAAAERGQPRAIAPGAWSGALWEAVQRPDEPPRRLAELAVAEIGPRAAAWAQWLRDTYPDAPTYGVVRLAITQAARGAVALALTEAGGPVLAPLRLPAAAWARVSVILRLAAVHGHDPTDRARADDLIALLELDPAATGEPFSLAGLGSLSGATGQLGLVRFAVSRLGFRKGPGAAVVRALFAAGEQSDSITRLAHRAARHFQARQPA